jgi:hypothetical protein
MNIEEVVKVAEDSFASSFKAQNIDNATLYAIQSIAASLLAITKVAVSTGGNGNYYPTIQVTH